MISHHQFVAISMLPIERDNGIYQRIGGVENVSFFVRLNRQQPVIHLCFFRLIGNGVAQPGKTGKGTVGVSLHASFGLPHG